MLVLTVACGSPTQEEIRICEEVTATELRPIAEHLSCIHDVIQYRLEKKIDVTFSPSIVAGGSSTTYRAALNSLLASGYLVEASKYHPIGSGWPDGTEAIPGYYPTAEGMDYLRKHRHPIRYWLGNNWFLLVVAIVNVVLGTAAAVNLVLRVTKRRSKG